MRFLPILLLGCTPGEPVDLVVSDAWSLVDAADDPFYDRPADATCAERGVEVSPAGVFVDTALCPYATLTQASMARVRLGWTLDLLVYHSALSAPDVAEAHIAVWLGDEPLLDVHQPMPAAPRIHDVALEAAVDADAGTPVYFHVHNHGSNSYTLGHLAVIR